MYETLSQPAARPRHARCGRTSRAFLCSSVALITLLHHAPARAAGDPASSAAPQARHAQAHAMKAHPRHAVAQTTSDVVVTAISAAGRAQRRPESLSVLDGAQLRARGIQSFATLAQATPGVSLKSEGPSQTEIEMRGITANGGNAPTVGFYLGNLALTGPAGAQNGHVVIDPSLYDLNRIEIARGPQGTDGGVMALAGSARLIPNAPDASAYHGAMNSILSGTDGGGFNHDDNLMLNLPLVRDKLALRLVGSEQYTSGWIDRIVAAPFPQAGGDPVGTVRGDVRDAPVVARHPGSNAAQNYATRASLLWQPTERITVSPSFFYETSHQDGISAFDSDPGTQAHYQPFDIAEPLTDRIAIYGLDASYRFDAFKVSSIFGYWTRHSTQTEEASESFNNPFQALTIDANPPFYGPSGIGPEYGHEIDPSRQYSEELRFSSLGGSRLGWTGGFYFSRFSSTWNFDGTTPNPAPYEDLGTLGPATTSDWFDADARTAESQYAVYGNVHYTLTPKLTAQLGLRLTRYDYSFASCISGWGSGLGAATPSCTGDVRLHNNDASPSFNLSYRLDPRTLVYVNIARAMRPAGGNSIYPTTGGVWGPVFQQFGFNGSRWPLTYKPDAMWSYEAGTKTRFWHDRITLDADLYAEDWQHIQLEALPADWALNINGRHATIFGGEVQAQAVLGAGFTLQATASYLHEHLDGGDHWVITPGDVLPEVARVVQSTVLSYSHPLDATYSLIGNIQNSFTGPRYSIAFPVIGGTFAGNGAWTRLRGYDLTDLRLGLRSARGWTITAFVDNIFDTRARLENLFQENLPTPTYNRIVTNQPLTGGIDLNATF